MSSGRPGTAPGREGQTFHGDALGSEPQLPRSPLLVSLGRVLAEQGSAAAIAHYRQSREQLEESYDAAPNYWAISAEMLVETKHTPPPCHSWS